MRKWLLICFAAAVGGLAACAPQNQPLTPTSAPVIDDIVPTIERSAAESAAPTAESAAQPVADRPAWFSLPLTNARTGETFTLGDYAGQVVYVEPMATWCTNCRAQMRNLIEARRQINNPNIVYIGLSVETTLAAGELASYADSYGFDWTFAVMTPEMVVELTNTFGRAVTTPPGSPHFLIYPDGSLSALSAGGIESADELVQVLTEAAA